MNFSAWGTTESMETQLLGSPRSLTAWEAETVSTLAPATWQVDVSALRVFRERPDGSVWFAPAIEKHVLVAHGNADDEDGEGVAVLLFGAPARQAVFMLEPERDDEQPVRSPSAVEVVWQLED
jgi:hypothetical protein